MKLRNAFRFFPENDALEAEFIAFQREEAPRLMAVASLLGALVVGAFWILDALTIGFSFFGGVQTGRAIAVTTLLGLSGLCVFRRAFILKHYTLLANVLFFLGMQMATIIAYTSRQHTITPDIFWALTSSVVTAIVVAFGASKLHSTNALLLVSTSAFTAIGIAVSIAGSTDAYLGRLILHISTSSAVCYFLRRAVESREIQLFMRMKERAQAEAHARQLELARVAAEQAQRVAEQADQAKANFLASMSHEIRTPLHGLLQLLQIASQRADKPQLELLNVARQSGEALLGVLNSILDYTAAARGKARNVRAPIDLNQLLGEGERLHRSAAHSKDLRLLTQPLLDPGCQYVLGSPVELMEVCNNAVSNAVKFTDAGQVKVTVDAQRSADLVQVTIVVTDTGIGMSSADLEKVFTPFWQADQSLSRVKPGTGLGLAHSKALMDAMGGTISVESVAGLGTKVTIQVSLPPAPEGSHRPTTDQAQTLDAPPPQPPAPTPAVPAEASPVAPALARQEPEPSGNAPHLPGPSTSLVGDVLLVEDNPLNAVVASTHLSSLGLSVVTATDGDEACRMFAERSFDLVLMDLQMPGVDGLDATRRMRAIELHMNRTPSAPIVAWTAHRGQAEQLRCQEAGMNGFLEKPYRFEELPSALAQWLSASATDSVSAPYLSSTNGDRP